MICKAIRYFAKLIRLQVIIGGGGGVAFAAAPAGGGGALAAEAPPAEEKKEEKEESEDEDMGFSLFDYCEQYSVRFLQTKEIQVSQENPSNIPDMEKQFLGNQHQHSVLEKLNTKCTKGSQPECQVRVQFAELLKSIIPQVDNERATQLHKLFFRLRKNKIAGENFLWLVQDIMGCQLLTEAVKKVQIQRVNKIVGEKGLIALDYIEPSIAFLDSLLLGEWEDRMQRGLFRYDVTACETKVIPGEYGFIAQLNEGRHLKKRPTKFRVDKVLQPFDGNKFNFTKVGQEEVLFQFEASDEDNETQFFPNAPIDVENSPSVVAINVSPIEYGHVLLIPWILECLPQRIDKVSFLLALYMAAEAGNPYFRLGYNSLGAFATINHLHFQTNARRDPPLPKFPAVYRAKGCFLIYLPRLINCNRTVPDSDYWWFCFQEIMHDPQVAADGFTYEGDALRGWLENGRETSPMTNLRLDHLHLTPNHALRLAIQDWLCKV
ncbi:hypothetical protein TEA_024714 [Camellia sinensis var. sinensis]|uniref:U-box domain-containing protein n=1 Tax=Camellia sinensis var. sinensis TaxID=542762 RepID=A0A4S4EBQ0_CAMSN|nr:hypothetical protein TEA_024714 [Camellia sinensis var. sinensis]